MGLIHPSEPTQAVFLTTDAFSVIEKIKVKDAVMKLSSPSSLLHMDSTQLSAADTNKLRKSDNNLVRHIASSGWDISRPSSLYHTISEYFYYDNPAHHELFFRHFNELFGKKYASVRVASREDIRKFIKMLIAQVALFEPPEEVTKKLAQITKSFNV